MENNKIAAQPPKTYTWEEMEATWRATWSEGITAMYEATRDLLPQPARNDLADWYNLEFWRFKHGHTDDLPAPPCFKIQRKRSKK